MKTTSTAGCEMMAVGSVVCVGMWNLVAQWEAMVAEMSQMAVTV